MVINYKEGILTHREQSIPIEEYKAFCLDRFTEYVWAHRIKSDNLNIVIDWNQVLRHKTLQSSFIKTRFNESK